MPPAQVSVGIEIDCPDPIAVHECRELQESRRRYAALRPGPCVWDCDLRKQLRSAPDRQQRSLVPQTHSVTFPGPPRVTTPGNMTPDVQSRLVWQFVRLLTGPIKILANVPQIPGFLGVIIMRLTEASRQSFRLQPTPWGARNAACPVGNPRCSIPTPGPLES